MLILLFSIIVILSVKSLKHGGSRKFCLFYYRKLSNREMRTCQSVVVFRLGINRQTKYLLFRKNLKILFQQARVVGERRQSRASLCPIDASGVILRYADMLFVCC